MTLHRLVGAVSDTEPRPIFANNTLNKPTWLVFRGDLSLVADWNSTTKSYAIVSLRASGGALSEKKVLLAAAAEPLVYMYA